MAKRRDNETSSEHDSTYKSICIKKKNFCDDNTIMKMKR